MLRLTNTCTGLLSAVASFNIFLSQNGLRVHQGSLPVMRGGQKPVMRGVSMLPNMPRNIKAVCWQSVATSYALSDEKVFMRILRMRQKCAAVKTLTYDHRMLRSPSMTYNFNAFYAYISGQNGIIRQETFRAAQEKLDRGMVYDHTCRIE